MLLYRGSHFVKGNIFKDDKGNNLVFEKNTKNGKLFKLDSEYVTLTESQADKLNLVNKLTESIKYDEYDTREKIRKEIGEIIKDNWMTIYSDEWFGINNLEVRLPLSSYNDEGIVDLTFSTRKEPFYIMSNYDYKSCPGLEKLKSELKTYGLKGLSIKTSKVKPNWDEREYRKVTRISFSLPAYLKDHEISFEKAE